jgi:hypothetical protein
MPGGPDIQPYRVEFQRHIGITWLKLGEFDSHSEALAAAEEHVEEYEGFARVVCQHIIHRVNFSDITQKRRRAQTRGATDGSK